MIIAVVVFLACCYVLILMGCDGLILVIVVMAAGDG